MIFNRFQPIVRPENVARARTQFSNQQSTGCFIGEMKLNGTGFAGNVNRAAV